MAEKPIAQNEEYADWGQEHEIRGRKCEETLAPSKRVQFGDSDDRTTSEDSGMILNDFLELFLATEISCDRNTPTDKAKSPVTFDDMVELYSPFSIYIGKADFKPNFWDTQPFLKSLLPNWKKGHEKTVSQITLHEQSRTNQMWMWPALFRNGMQRERLERVRSRRLQCRQCLDRKMLTYTDNATNLTALLL
jgi:hypothetical protein